MAGITQFEELIAWQRARELTAAVRRIAAGPPLSRDAALASQLRRAATSVMANVAEGFESSTPAEFNRFLGIAKASAAEVRSHLYVALDATLISQKEFDGLMRLGKSTSELVSALKLSVQRRIASLKSQKP
jgi:four helix bundle protein